VDGKVFLTMVTPVSISLHARALHLLDFQSVDATKNIRGPQEDLSHPSARTYSL
jgi:hypothetical protein